MAVTTMVGGVLAINKTQETVDHQDHPINCQPKRPRLQTTVREPSRMETISNILTTRLSQPAVDLLLKGERERTKIAYESAWKRFKLFCQARNQDPDQYNIDLGLEYLTSLKEKSRSTVNLARTAISNTWKYFHPTQPLFGENKLTQAIIKGVRESLPKRPPKPPSWDSSKLLNYLREIDSEKTNLKMLSHKAVTLLALASFWRPKSDLSRIPLDQVSFTAEGLFISACKPKEGDFKSTEIRRHPEEAICPVATLECYIDRTKDLRKDRSKSLFITFNKPHGSASADTLGRWVVNTLNAAGIKAKAHSIRSIASTEAFFAGLPINIILKKANWKSEATFRNFYLRPSTKDPIRSSRSG